MFQERLFELEVKGERLDEINAERVLNQRARRRSQRAKRNGQLLINLGQQLVNLSNRLAHQPANAQFQA